MVVYSSASWALHSRVVEREVWSQADLAVECSPDTLIRLLFLANSLAFLNLSLSMFKVGVIQLLETPGYVEHKSI